MNINMKQLVSKSIAVCMLTLMLAACNNAKQYTDEKVSNEQSPSSITQLEPAMKMQNDQLLAVYEQYELLTQALISGNSKEARIASNAVEAGASQLLGGTDIADKAGAITATSNIDEQREAFAALSGSVIALVKQTGLRAGKLYVDYCPMARKNSGAYWLSRQSSIRNPYFGEQMMTCGEISEIL